MKKHLINFFKFLLFLGVGLTILYVVFRKQQAAYLEECLLNGIAAEDCSLVQKVIDDFKSAHLFWMGMVFLAYILSNVSRALRWMMLIKPLGRIPRFVNVFSAVMLGYFGNLGLPRLGEVMRAVAVSKYENIPVEKVVGTVIVERIMDVICLLACIGLCFILEFETIYTYLQKAQSGDSGPNYLLYAILGIGVFLLLLGFLFRNQIAAHPLFKKVITIAKGFGEGILSIRQMERPGLFIFHSIFIWLMYFLMTYFCFFAFAPTAGLAPKVALLAFVVGAMAITVPSPGGMGTYHVFVTSLLALYGIGETDAFSFANILFFSVQLGINVLLGLLCLLALPPLNRNYHPTPIEN